MPSANDSKFAVRLILIGVAVVILVVLVMQYSAKQKTISTQEESIPFKLTRERYEEPMPSTLLPPQQSQQMAPSTGMVPTDAGNVKPAEPMSNEDYKAVDFESESKLPTDCFPRDKLTAEDLLPKDAANSKWAQVNPAGQGEVKDQNFLNAGFHIGVNTVGQSLRNPNYQLRSEPPNPKLPTGPWNQTTIEFDNSRKYFEIGEC